MKSRNKKRLLALVLCMVVAISNSSFIFASETGQAEYPQEAEVQTQDEAVADDMDVAAYAADEGQAVAEEQTAPVEQVAEEPETTAAAPAEQPTAEAPAAEQPTAEAPAAEQPTAEAPAAEQPTTEASAAETPAAQEPAAVPTEETAPAAENATAETPEEDATQAEAENQQLTWSQVVGNTTVNVTAEAGALPADAQLSVTEITSEDEVKEIEKAVEEKAIEEQFSIKNIFSYDIKFLVDGSEVQPTTPVQVSVDTPEITSSEDAAVLHVDDNNVAEDMKGAVDGEGKVVFDAPHFSKYVIVQKGDAKVNVTIEYYDDTQNPKTMIYASKKELSPGESISNYDIADNWTFYRAEKITADEDPEDIRSLDALNNNKITRDCTIKVYYTPKNEKITGSTKFYDYTVKAGEENGKYHSFNELKNDKSPDTDINNNQKLIAGSNDPNPNVNHNYPEYQKYKISLKDSENDTKDANRYTGGTNTIPGLLKKIDDNGDVIFNYAEPGFFVDKDAYYITSGNEKRYLRKVYWDYTLEFDRSGDTYNLSGVRNGKGGWTSAGDNFYPLEDVKPTYEKSETYRNNYFGMRYDVTFKIGDYVGPLNYQFTGDDDLWVVLDNENIVIDLGGIHQAATKNVDLWNYIKKGANLSDAEKQQNHTLTILYMERGAVASNCQMKFTLPNASIVQVTQEPLANFSFKKVNTNKVALPGAKFSLTNNSDSAKVYEATSDSNGTVLFSDLREGTYTLEETKAPEGYSLSNETWIVKVSKTGDSAVATLYKSDETTPVQPTNGVYNIVNQTQQEIIKSSMEHSKTATVKNWDERTYNINIKAASTSTSETTSTQKPVADIMLVLDVSRSMGYSVTPTYKYVAMNTEEGRNGLDTGTTYYLESNGKYKSMKYYEESWWYEAGWYVGDYKAETYRSDCKIYTKITTRLDALKYSVNQFIDDTKAKSPNSKIGITAFSSSGYNNHKKTKDLTEVGAANTNNAQDLKDFVNKLNANGGTDPGAGLSKAKEILDSVASDGKTKCVVLFTDGEPTGNNTNGEWVAQDSAEKEAKKLRDEGYTVYTIGFALDDRSKTFLAGGIYNGTKYPGIASSGCAKVADDAASLGEIFKEIENTITNDIDIVGAIVTDVIDPRFVIVKDNGETIKNEDLENGKTINLNNGGVVSLDKKGNQVITWTDQTIPNKKRKEWSNTITVKAKDDYIGGNNVPTNVTPDSKITTGYDEVVLPQPKVNVKAELTVRDKEVTIYKGDNLPDKSTVLNEMFDLAGNTSKYNISPDSFTIKWYSNPECTTEVTDLTADVNATYYLKVSYNAGKPSIESTANTSNNIAGDADHIVDAVNKNDLTKPYGVYTIKVISGKIQITKKLKSTLDTECTFYFSIKDESGKKIKKVSITVPANSDEATYIGDELKNLSRGTYTVSEEDSNGYVLTDYQVGDSTNCRNTSDTQNESVTFKLGYEKKAGSDGEDVDVIKNNAYNPKDGGTLGSVTFTNEKATTAWDIVKVSANGNDVYLQGAEFVLKKGGNEVYTGTSDNTGKIIWEKDGNVVPSLEKGEYTLKETKAPTGYVLSDEEWTIKITKGGSLVSYTTNKSNGETNKIKISETDGILHLYFKNEVVYDLPSTGHTGIFNILMSGILLMFAGILIIYKMRGKGVLKK